MNLLSRLIKGKEKKEQLEPDKTGTQELGSEDSRKGVGGGGKWIVRCRLPNGQLKHLCTLQHKPTDKDLGLYGPGEYSIQKVGRKFGKAQKIIVDETPIGNSAPRRTVPDQTSHHLDRDLTEDLRKSSTIAEKKSPPKMLGRKLIDKKRIDKAWISSPTVQRTIHQMSSREERRSGREGIQSESDTTTRDKPKTSYPPAVTNSLSDEKNEVVITESVRMLPADHNLGNYADQFDTQQRSNEKSGPIHNLILSEKPRIAERPRASPLPQKENRLVVDQMAKEKRMISCAKCGDTICEEDELWLFKYNGKTCEYCTKDYCDECFPQHICPSSKLCAFCDRRFSNEFVAVAQYCRKKYCSIQCSNLCLEKNKDRPECWGCGKSEEKAEESDQDEGSEEVYDCPACETSFEEDVNRSYICMDCDDELFFFCSRRCFGRYHRRKGLDHEGMTFGEFDKKF